MARSRTLYLLFAVLLLPLTALAEITKSQFDLIIATAENQYDPVFHDKNKRLNISAAWHNDNIYASAWKIADKRGETGLIQISGGFARQHGMTAPAFALVLCHEIGHHIAGPPKIWRFSAEGQSDYFGASDCLRKLFRRGIFEPEFGHIPRVVRKACEQSFTINEERHICTRIALAGATLANYFAQKKNQPKPLFNRRDNSIAEKTILVPASPQCRLDTYFAAALCNPAAHSYNPEHQWLCHSTSEQSPSNRPSCWFNPEDH